MWILDREVAGSRLLCILCFFIYRLTGAGVEVGDTESRGGDSRLVRSHEGALQVWSVIKRWRLIEQGFNKILELYLYKFWQNTGLVLFCFDVPEGATGPGRRLPLTPSACPTLCLQLLRLALLSHSFLLLPAPAGSRSGDLLLAVHPLLPFLHLAGVTTYSGSDVLLPETSASD